MDKDTITKLKGEAATLRQRLAAIDSLLALYTGKPSSSAPDQVVKRSYQRSPGQAGQILEICRPIIEKSGSTPVPTRKLLDDVTSQGITVGGKNAIATLSAIISNSDLFINKDRQGWVLKQQQPSEIVDDFGEEIPF